MTNRRRPTSKQVAEIAGVSQTTVSFVLNNVQDANISEETRRRVLEAARQLNYFPDMAARSLARGRTDTIALVLVQPHRQVFIDEYIPRILTGISDITRQHGFRILVEQAIGSTAINVYRRLLQSREAAGVIINFSSYTVQDIESIIECTRAGMPIVTLNNVHPDIYSVEVDKYAGVRTIVQHLINVGHRRIACIAYDSNPANLHVATRLEIFCQTLVDNGLTVDPALIRPGQFDPETGYTAMQAILEAQPLPDAVFGMNDMMAFGAMRAICEAGLRIPEDIAVAGFDDVRLAGFSQPPLTTVKEPDEEHGRQAASMLIHLVNGGEVAEKHVVLNTRLIIRESCGLTSKNK